MAPILPFVTVWAVALPERTDTGLDRPLVVTRSVTADWLRETRIGDVGSVKRPIWSPTGSLTVVVAPMLTVRLASHVSGMHRAPERVPASGSSTMGTTEAFKGLLLPA
ncbi:MAG: hypothetical protein MUE31_05460 [Candidatus Nanopelagicales bacterium]|nr:hypothetical protein [Candidatus Nanopelagicales bacterium]